MLISSTPHRLPLLSLSLFVTHFRTITTPSTTLSFRYQQPKNLSPLLLTLASSSTMAATAGDSDHFSTVVVDAAAAADEKKKVVAVVEDLVKFGFKREEMFKANLAGTVDPYDRHVFLAYKSHDVWPAKVEDSESDLLPMLLSVVLKNRKSDMNLKTRLTICEADEGLGLSDGDVLIFPDMVKYRELDESNVDQFVEDVLVKGTPWSGGKAEDLSGSYVFVCAHNKRDRRCGVCGPILIDTFKELIESKSLKEQVFVLACSHVGGHKYAGNAIIFSADAEGKTSGHWYGYVTPEDVPELLDQHIVKSQIIDRLWRGQMGTVEYVAEAKEEEKEKPKPANETKQSNGEVKKHEEKETSFSCCQGERGVSCCQVDTSSSAKEEETSKKAAVVPKWVGNWEQSDVLKAIALAGLVTATAVGYRIYQRSK